MRCMAAERRAAERRGALTQHRSTERRRHRRVTRLLHALRGGVRLRLGGTLGLVGLGARLQCSAEPKVRTCASSRAAVRAVSRALRTVSAARVASTFIFSAVDIVDALRACLEEGSWDERAELAADCAAPFRDAFRPLCDIMMPLVRLRLALARVRHVHRAAPACAAAAGDPRGPVDGDGFAPWGGGDDAAPRDRKADGAHEVQGADFEAGGAPPKSTTEKARASTMISRARPSKCRGISPDASSGIAARRATSAAASPAWRRRRTRLARARSRPAQTPSAKRCARRRRMPSSRASSPGACIGPRLLRLALAVPARDSQMLTCAYRGR